MIIDPLDNFSLKATETNPLGYELYICYECQINKVPPETGTIDITTEIFIEAHPLGCSKTLQYRETNNQNPTTFY